MYIISVGLCLDDRQDTDYIFVAAMTTCKYTSEYAHTSSFVTTKVHLYKEKIS